MQCPKCGYMLEPLDERCPRCERMRTTSDKEDKPESSMKVVPTENESEIEISIPCPRCGREHDGQARFCQACGAALHTFGEPSTVQPSAREVNLTLQETQPQPHPPSPQTSAPVGIPLQLGSVGGNINEQARQIARTQAQRPTVNKVQLVLVVAIVVLLCGFGYVANMVDTSNKALKNASTMGPKPTQAPAPAPTPEPAPAPEQPQQEAEPKGNGGAIGSEARLYTGSGGSPILLGVDEEACNEIIKAYIAKDKYGLRDLWSTGRAFAVPNNTRVLVLDIGWIGTRRVRILEGESAGMAGWVIKEFVFG